MTITLQMSNQPRFSARSKRGKPVVGEMAQWKHAIRADGEGWWAHNPETGLTARFDQRGVEIQPESPKEPEGLNWRWGLELVSHGIGKSQRSTAGIVPKVQTTERRIGYQWDDNLEEWYKNDGHWLENGFTIRERPASTITTDSLVLRLRIRGGLRVINRIGGDLIRGAHQLGPLAGLLFDDSETSRSFTLTGRACQLHGLVGNNLPRTVPRYATVIPAGRTGWMKFWAAVDEALSGVMINEAVSDLSGGYNLQILTTTNSVSLIIPVIPVS